MARSRHGRPHFALLLTLIGLLAGPTLLPRASLRAQTPVTSIGLGAPVPALDARAAALGGTGLGLLGGSLSARNPADIAFFESPVLGITYAPEGASVDGIGRTADTGRSRVSVLRGAVPFGDWAVGLALASELDQDWRISFADTLVAAAGTYPFSEQRDQDGGVASINLSGARRLGRVTIGAEYGILTGSARQRFLREFEPDLDDDTNRLAPAGSITSWNYSGSRIRVGASAEVTRRVRVSADLSIQGDLTADRDSISGIARTRVYDMPMAFEAGASVQATDRLMLTGAGGWTGWGGSTGGSPSFDAADIVWAGIGAELTGTRILGAAVPLRLGFRRTDLPFFRPGGSQASESAVTGGFGLRVAQDQARFDVALELGSRGDLAKAGFKESFQRLSISMALFQN
jgi:hypothetical protein